MEPAAEAIALAAMVTDHEARIRALEDDLTALTRDVKPDLPDATTWDQLPRADWWMPDTLLSDGGKVWRNTSGTVLTTPPSGFPGAPSQWTHMFVEHGGAIDPDPGPTRPAGYVGTWSATADYKIGDVVDRGGRYYRCVTAHGAAYQGTWGPPAAGVWTDIGVA